jgi:hypothetical protein
MRTLVTILAVSLTLISYAQQNNNQRPTIDLDDVLVTANLSYLNTVQDESTPATAKRLQQEVATYSVQANSDFDKSVKQPFEMIFKNAYGTIDAFYDASGKVIESYEKFKNILLPGPIRDQVFRENLDWEMISNQYVSDYSGDNLIKRSYKVRLQNGKHKKDVIINLR